MNPKQRGLAETAKENIVAAAEITGEFLNAVIHATSSVILNAIESVGYLGTSFFEVAEEVTRGAIHGAVEIGSDLALTAKGIVIGVLEASKEISNETLDVIAYTAGNIVKNTAEVAGDVVSAATGAVQGAISGAREVGLDVEEAASAAATGVVKAAYEISAEVGMKVRDAIKGTLSGVKVVLQEPFDLGTEKQGKWSKKKEMGNHPSEGETHSKRR